ncbi:unnamed protein product [Lupinus luteus]|uniref:Uncharacterized protein n=1 Tax=Lupinus luteus TaxID=3873 RepID=A0AAV1X172_LUPLU
MLQLWHVWPPFGKLPCSYDFAPSKGDPTPEDGTQVKENSPSGAPKVAPNDDDGSVHVAPENREVAKELNNLHDNSHNNNEDLFGPWMLVQRTKNKRKPRGGHVTKGNSSIGNQKKINYTHENDGLIGNKGDSNGVKSVTLGPTHLFSREQISKEIINFDVGNSSGQTHYSSQQRANGPMGHKKSLSSIRSGINSSPVLGASNSTFIEAPTYALSKITKGSSQSVQNFQANSSEDCSVYGTTKRNGVVSDGVSELEDHDAHNVGLDVSLM